MNSFCADIVVNPCTWIFFLFVLYKVLDRLLRWPMIRHYDGRYILVTGCDSGFGNLIAKRLDERGCHVFAGCYTETGETELKKTCSPRLHAIHLDVGKPESVRKAFDYVKSKLPSGRGLWGVLNNAGVMSKLGPPEWMTLDEYSNVNLVNLLGPIDITMTFLPLVKAEHGRIVSTSSIFARVALQDAIPYCVSKYGVEAFVDGLRRSLRAFGCKAILIEPGIHVTAMGSAETLKPLYKKGWDETTPEVREEFGDDYYNFVSTRAVENIQRLSSKKLSDVVDAYEHALLGRYPRARYVVGNDAKFVWLPIHALPEWLGDWLFQIGDPGRPVPKAVQNQ